MGLLSDFFIASSEDLPVLGDSESLPRDHFETLELKGVESVMIAQLRVIVEGISFENAVNEMDLAFAVSEEDGPWVEAIPATLRNRLADCAPAEQRVIAAKWWKTEEFEGWTEEEVAEILRQLVAISRRSIEVEKDLFLWVCL